MAIQNQLLQQLGRVFGKQLQEKHILGTCMHAPGMIETRKPDSKVMIEKSHSKGQSHVTEKSPFEN